MTTYWRLLTDVEIKKSCNFVFDGMYLGATGVYMHGRAYRPSNTSPCLCSICRHSGIAVSSCTSSQVMPQLGVGYHSQTPDYTAASRHLQLPVVVFELVSMANLQEKLFLSLSATQTASV